jgi:hypothetical protein
LHEASRDLLDKKLLCPLLKIEMAYEFPHEKKEINRKRIFFGNRADVSQYPTTSQGY